MPRSVPHEFQHYLHALNKMFVPELVNNVAGGYFDDSFDRRGRLDARRGPRARRRRKPAAVVETRAKLAFDLHVQRPATTRSPRSRATMPTRSSSHRRRLRVLPLDRGQLRRRISLRPLSVRPLRRRCRTSPRLRRPDARRGGRRERISRSSREANGESFAQVYGEFAGALAARNVASTDPRFRFGLERAVARPRDATVPRRRPGTSASTVRVRPKTSPARRPRRRRASSSRRAAAP